MSSKLIFVTGASGFLGTHIVSHLLDEGYSVRAAARGEKVGLLNQSYAKYAGRFEAVNISDTASGEFPEALEGVDGVIHTAAPLAGRAAPEVVLKSAIEGTLNVIRQAEKAGVKRIVATSSIGAVLNPSNSFTDKDWNPVKKEEALGDPAKTYMVAKTVAERAIWEFADLHPDIDITTICPPYLYGSFARGFSLSELNYNALSTNLYIYRLLKPDGVFPQLPGYNDVRDVARAHVAALTSPLESSVGRKRIIMSSPHDLDYKVVLDFIADKRPELKDRLADKSKAPVDTLHRIPVDLKRIEDVLGIRVDSYYSWEQTILDTVDGLLAFEDEWKSKGYTITIPNTV